jgi:hypothetical protein
VNDAQKQMILNILVHKIYLLIQLQQRIPSRTGFLSEKIKVRVGVDNNR